MNTENKNVVEPNDIGDDSKEKGMTIQKTAAVEKKEKEAAKEAAVAEKTKYPVGDLKSFLALADESTGNHKKFSRDPYLLDEFAKTQRAQPPMMSHGLLLSILLFFLNIVTFLGGKGWSGPILPQKVERQPLFPLKIDPAKMKTLENTEKMEFEVGKHHIEILKSDLAHKDAKAGVIGLKGIVVDGTRYDFSTLCGELSKKCGPDKAVEILSTISDFSMLSITPDAVAAERKSFVEKQHENILSSMEKSSSDLAADVIWERSQAAQETPTPAPRRSECTFTEEEKVKIRQRLDKITEDAKIYRPAPMAARSQNDDDNAPRA